jgi:hypothetical protein
MMQPVLLQKQSDYMAELVTVSLWFLYHNVVTILDYTEWKSRMVGALEKILNKVAVV